MHRLTEYRLGKGLGLTTLALLFGLGLGTAQADDMGSRHHAEGRYDAANATYQVVAGDDLDAIAERFGVTPQALTNANNLSSTVIDVGQHLTIPGAATGTPAPGPTPQGMMAGIGALTGTPADPRYKYSTSLPPGVAAPDSIETRLGTLRFFDGFPDKASAEKLYDNLDFERAVQSFLLGMPAVSQVANRAAFSTLGPPNTVVPIFEHLLDSRGIVLTGNDNTVYSWTWLDLIDGPLVLEVPPKVLGTANDMWQHWIVDVGITGPDKGKGGKYLFLPPGYKDEAPSGYYVVHSPTFGLWVPWRSFLVDGDPAPGVELVKKFTKIYPLSEAGKAVAPPMFIDMSGKPFNTVFPTDYRFWEMLNEVVQQEPTDSLDPVTLGFFQSIGIQKGKPFAPDARMKKILTEAAAVGDATARAILFHTRDRAAYYYKDSNWQLGFIGGYQFQAAPGVADFDAATFYYYLAILVTPAMEEKMIGKGSQYAWTARDANGDPLDGGKSYRLHLPPNVPVKDFWSLILYSDQTRSQIQTDQRFPSMSSQTKGLRKNADGSIDVYFGPKAPAGKESNWVQTVPDRGWNVVLRMYGALEPWFDHSWRPGEIEPRP
ncbi:MAG: DUF1214 domain-containing protein [Candidatus Competibacteraceae bacterium]|nr:DUF1214 domain-containing protein [Candidatus Competibacteraceae bacterium]